MVTRRVISPMPEATFRSAKDKRPTLVAKVSFCACSVVTSRVTALTTTVFVRAHHGSGRLKLQFWVGIELQSFLTEDSRYSIPMYMGSGGWIDLDVQDQIHWEEVESLLENSYRHFALIRMLKALDSEQEL